MLSLLVSGVTVLVSASCHPLHTRTIDIRDSMPGSPMGLAESREVVLGGLAYPSLFLGKRLWFSTELAVNFELVARRLDSSHSLRELYRVELGPPDWDITGIAAADPSLGLSSVWISSRAGIISALDVESGATLLQWRVGFPATAIAVSADGRYVAYGGSEGIVCLRRTHDQALLQCAIFSDHEVSALTFVNDVLIAGDAGGMVSRWSVPALKRLGAIAVGGRVSMLDERGGAIAIAVGARVGRPRQWGSGGVYVWRADGSRATCVSSSMPVSAISWVDAKTLLSGSASGQVHLYSFKSTLGSCRLLSMLVFDNPVSFLVSHPSGAFAGIGLWAQESDQPSVLLVDYLYPSR